MERGTRARDLGKTIGYRKREPGRGLFAAGVKRPRALAKLGVLEDYAFIMHPTGTRHWPTLFVGLSKRVESKLASRSVILFRGGGDAVQTEMVIIRAEVCAA